MTIDSVTTDVDSIKKFIAGIEEQPKEAEVKPEEGGVDAVAGMKKGLTKIPLIGGLFA